MEVGEELRRPVEDLDVEARDVLFGSKRHADGWPEGKQPTKLTLFFRATSFRTRLRQYPSAYLRSTLHLAPDNMDNLLRCTARTRLHRQGCKTSWTRSYRKGIVPLYDGVRPKPCRVAECSLRRLRLQRQ